MRRLAYIMGPNYSGSTLLTILLSDHHEIATVGELKATAMGDIATYRCSCGELLTMCAFWRNIESELKKKGRPFSFERFGTHFRAPGSPITDRLLRASLRGPLFETARAAGFLFFPKASKARKDIVEQNRLVIDAVCSHYQANTFLDDSKEPIRLKFFLSTGLWDIRVIHLVRDGRGVANSYMRHNRTGMKQAAMAWAHTQRECDRMAASLDAKRCLTVHYEELCRHSERTLNSIYDFLGIAGGKSNSAERVKHILGNQMRLNSLQDVRLDEKWKTTLSLEDLRIFDKVAGRLNRFHGYL